MPNAGDKEPLHARREYDAVQSATRSIIFSVLRKDSKILEWNIAFALGNTLRSCFDVNGYPPTIIHVIRRLPVD